MTPKQQYKDRAAAVVVGLSVTGLGVVRSLAKCGVHVIAVDSRFDQPSAHTKYCEKVLCKDINNKDELLQTLVTIGKQRSEKPVLFLTTDMSVLIASENREAIEDYCCFNLPSKPDVRTLIDKKLFADFARKNGFQIPRTFSVNDSGEVESVAMEVQYPCIIKPCFRTPRWDQNTPVKGFKAFSGDELIRVYNSNALLVREFVVQEYVPGMDRNVYFCLLWYNSRSQPIASFEGRKVLQWPPQLGSTCIAESCSNDAVMEESIKLLNAVNYKGIGSVEFKKDSRDGILKIIEPTVGRADLQSALAFHAGVNMPILEYCDCLGLRLPDFTNGNGKMRWINEENLFWLLTGLEGTGSLKQVLRVMSHEKHCALFSLQDLKPFSQLLCQILGRRVPFLGRGLIS